MLRSAFFVVPPALLTLAVLACGGNAPKAAVSVPPLDAGADAKSAAPTFATSPPPSGLPAMAPMPPPGVRGSKKASLKRDPALVTCAASRAPGTPDAQVKKLAEACSAVSKMKPVSAVLRGQQGDKEAAQENAFRAEANHCYRIYAAGDDGAKDVVVVLRDSNGDVVVEAPAPTVPEDGAVCFTEADQVSLVVGVGAGKGGWVAQVWGN
jgi:hypothetical protein